MSLAEAELEEQRSNNRSALPYRDEFAGHRTRLTDLVVRAAPERGRLCVLGAGNCYDLDLPRLARSYTEVHLVDIDEEALGAAVARQDEETRARLVLHAPVDLSALQGRLENWAQMRVTEQELVNQPRLGAAEIGQAIGGTFEVVVSACVFTQMQLWLVRVLSDQHPLFEAARITLSVTHLRTLGALLAPGGRALFVTDSSSDLIAPLDELSKKLSPLHMVEQLTLSGAIFQVTDARLLAQLVKDDPVLRKQLAVSGPTDAWLWRNGPERQLLVYALELAARPA
jgi:hypothetical protein